MLTLAKLSSMADFIANPVSNFIYFPIWSAFALSLAIFSQYISSEFYHVPHYIN
jgi:hypothetical protein